MSTSSLAWRAKQNYPSTLCRSCWHRLNRLHRQYSTTATETANTDPSQLDLGGEAPLPISTTDESPAAKYRTEAAVLLSRPPLLTRDLTNFEKAYFLYQRRLNERLALPFTRYFYYQKGTPGDVEWKRKIRHRLTPARDIGKYTAYSPEAWNDELLVGDTTSEPQNQIDALVNDAEDKESSTGSGRRGDEAIDRPNLRVTEADVNNDTRSLNRALARTLYLVVRKAKDGEARERWGLPRSELRNDEHLHRAASRIIWQAAGNNMNTWVVGNMPVGHDIYHHPTYLKLFYMKARMMAGRVNLQGNHLGYVDYQWLEKEKLQQLLHPREFAGFKALLSTR